MIRNLEDMLTAQQFDRARLMVRIVHHVHPCTLLWILNLFVSFASWIGVWWLISSSELVTLWSNWQLSFSVLNNRIVLIGSLHFWFAELQFSCGDISYFISGKLHKHCITTQHSPGGWRSIFYYIHKFSEQFIHRNTNLLEVIKALSFHEFPGAIRLAYSYCPFKFAVGEFMTNWI